jgi:hypothetical protein
MIDKVFRGLFGAEASFYPIPFRLVFLLLPGSGVVSGVEAIPMPSPKRCAVFFEAQFGFYRIEDLLHQFFPCGVDKGYLCGVYLPGAAHVGIGNGAAAFAEGRPARFLNKGFGLQRRHRQVDLAEAFYD